MIKSEINGIESDNYPCLKRCEDIIVLFTKPLTGICLLAGKKNTDKLGETKQIGWNLNFANLLEI